MIRQEWAVLARWVLVFDELKVNRENSTYRIDVNIYARRDW